MKTLNFSNLSLKQKRLKTETAAKLNALPPAIWDMAFKGKLGNRLWALNRA